MSWWNHLPCSLLKSPRFGEKKSIWECKKCISDILTSLDKVLEASLEPSEHNVFIVLLLPRKNCLQCTSKTATQLAQLYLGVCQGKCNTSGPWSTDQKVQNVCLNVSWPHFCEETCLLSIWTSSPLFQFPYKILYLDEFAMISRLQVIGNNDIRPSMQLC